MNTGHDADGVSFSRSYSAICATSPGIWPSLLSWSGRLTWGTGF